MSSSTTPTSTPGQSGLKQQQLSLITIMKVGNVEIPNEIGIMGWSNLLHVHKTINTQILCPWRHHKITAPNAELAHKTQKKIGHSHNTRKLLIQFNNQSQREWDALKLVKQDQNFLAFCSSHSTALHLPWETFVLIWNPHSVLRQLFLERLSPQLKLQPCARDPLLSPYWLPIPCYCNSREIKEITRWNPLPGMGRAAMPTSEQKSTELTPWEKG